MSREPLVSICTVTYQRPGLLELLEQRIRSQTYPPNKIQWVILDDSPEPHQRYQKMTGDPTKPAIKYIHLSEKLPLGKKRNESHLYCDGDIIVYMDDDDFYPPSRIQHAVHSLMDSEKEIAGSSTLPILCIDNADFSMSKSVSENHLSPGTFAFKRSYLENHSYTEEDMFEEERDFLNNYTTPIIQLDPFQTILCISHDSNTNKKYATPQKTGTVQSFIDNSREQTQISETQRKVLNLIRDEHLAARAAPATIKTRYTF